MSVKNLQPNVDRTLIKVAECVRLFESIYNEMHASTDITQEDGLERDLKTQLKKLQRLRNEIKTLVASNDIKDKAALLENLGLIKTQIKKFKAYLFKKEDIIYFGPRVYEKLALEEWSRECLDTLQYQVDAEDLWIDMLLYEEEGKTGVIEKNQNKIEEVKRRIERQKGVMSRLEPISILITQNILSTVQIGTLKDHLDYFMNHAVAARFSLAEAASLTFAEQDGYDDEDENIFGDFPLDEEECSSLIAECYNSRGQRHGHKAILRYLSSFTGTTVTLLTKNAKTFEGVIGSTTKKHGQKQGVILRDAKDLTVPGAPVQTQIFIASTDIDSWSFPADPNMSGLRTSTTNSRADSKESSLLQTLRLLAGTIITLTTKAAKRYEGTVEYSSENGIMAGLTLRDVKELSTPGVPLKGQVFIPVTDIDTWSSGPEDAKVRKGASSKTEADADISQKSPHRRSDLYTWQANLPPPAIASAGPSHGQRTNDVTFGAGASRRVEWNDFFADRKPSPKEASFSKDLFANMQGRFGAALAERNMTGTPIWHETVQDERQQPTKMSSEPEEASAAPVMLPVHKYIFKNSNRNPKSSCPKSTNHALSPTIPMTCIEPRGEGVDAPLSSSSPIDGVQPAAAPPVEKEPTFLTTEPASTGSSSNDFGDAASIDGPPTPPSEVGHPMSIETAPPDHSAVGEGSKYSSGECIGYDTGADDVPPSPQLSTNCLENASNHGRPSPEQSRTMFGSQYEDHTGRVPMGRLASAGWQEFVLPDGTRYFSNRALNVVADVDLRDAERLTAVTRFLDGDDVETLTQLEWELWLRDSSELTTVFIPRQAWIHHGERMAVFKPTAPNPGELMNEDIDKMESEYQYWLFMVSHPVHALLPPESIAEAIEVLTWFNINRLLPSPRLSPPPFSEEECQELLTELRSFNHVSVQTVSLLRTCVVSTILVRVVAWRQGRRYHSATSQDPQNDKSTLLTGISLLRTAGDSIISFVCSGLSNMSLGHRELVYIVLMAVAWSLALFLA